MREEHPNQTELPGLPSGGPAPAPGSDQVREMSEVAKLQSEVLPLGLVREARPVFVYDEKLAKEKTGNAARQARFREKRAAQGLVMAQIPAEIVDRLKAVEGDWSRLLGAMGAPPNPAPVSPPAGDLTYVRPAPGQQVREVIVEVIKEVRVEVPGPVRIVEKIVEKPVQKLTSEQKKIYELGVKVRNLQGWRARFLRWIL